MFSLSSNLHIIAESDDQTIQLISLSIICIYWQSRMIELNDKVSQLYALCVEWDCFVKGVCWALLFRCSSS